MQSESKQHSRELEGAFLKTFSFTRKKMYFFLLCCFLAPIFITASSTFSFCRNEIFWIATLAALLSGGVGWYVLRVWEQKMQRTVNELVRIRIQNISGSSEQNSKHAAVFKEEIQRLESELEKVRAGYEHQISLLQSSATKSKDKIQQLNLEMDKKLEEMRLAYLEFEDLRKEYHRLEEDLFKVKEEAHKSLKHKDSLISEYQCTISEQRSILEKKQSYIAQLENKVHDLMYEIRSLLQLEESSSRYSPLPVDMNEKAMREYYLPNASSSHVPYDVSQQLHRCINQAEALTGVDHLGYVGGNSPRFLDMSLESYAVDRRRLFDSFKDESIGVLFIYSKREKRFLFVNQCVKNLIGWSPEKLIKEFSRLVVHGYEEWLEVVNQVKPNKESRTKLEILNKSGHKMSFECYLGLINQGPFANHVLGILAR